MLKLKEKITMLLITYLSINILVIFKSISGQYIVSNSNSCIDSCETDFVSSYTIDLNSGQSKSNDNELVEVLQDNIKLDNSNLECSKNGLLRIPFSKLANGTIVKLELTFNDVAKGVSFHIGNSPTNDLYGGDRNTTIYNAEMYANNTNLNFYMSMVSLCAQDYEGDADNDLPRILLLNESSHHISPKTKMTIYISEQFIRVDDPEKPPLYYNNPYLFSFEKSANISSKCKISQPNKASPYLYIGLNRVIADAALIPGSGLCNTEISFLNCQAPAQPDIDINVNEMKYKNLDEDNLVWLNPLNYLEPAMEHTKCSGQGVLKLKFSNRKFKKIARFDLELGELISGFTFNIGDSPSNNAYGGDSGSTSNSAELHSNDNRFYVWLNTKYCGETLLYRIEYNLLQSFDNLTLFISNERIEITNYRGYHEIYKNPYLYNLNNQNVTCNCFDTRCYPGVMPDSEVYFGINRVIGGTFRPGVGLCNAKISWIQCKNDFKRVKLSSNDGQNFGFSNSSKRSRVNEEEKPNSFKEPLIGADNNKERLTNEIKETKHFLGKYDKGVPLMISQNITVINSTTFMIDNQTNSTSNQFNKTKIIENSQNPCTKENIDNEVLYHEYKADSNKFIYCEKVNTFRILTCPLNMKWSQLFQQCMEN